jgi:PAS domain S-box-containing protein
MEEEQRILTSLTFSPYALMVCQRDDGHILAVNKQFCEKLGYHADHIEGKCLAELAFWKNDSQSNLFLGRLKNNEDLSNWETELIGGDGQVIPYVLSSHQGPIHGKSWALISGREFSDHKKIEEALRHSETLYREAQEIAHLGHWELDLQINRLIWSEEIFKIFEIDPTDFSESYDTFLTLIHPDDRHVVDQAYRLSLEKKTPYDVIHRLKMADGRIKYVHERGQSQWNEDGHPVRTIGTVQDITPSKEAELARERLENQLRQSQKLEALGTLVSGIAHDFNNILSIILGYTELSLEQVTQESILYDNMEEIFNATIRARELVAQILSFARSQPQQKCVLEIQLIIKEVLKLIRSTLPASINIHQSLATNAKVLADSVQLHQVFMNLFTNAAHAMTDCETGFLSVELDVIDLDENDIKRFVDITPGRYIKLSVGDTGTGMAPDVKERIFEPFFTTKPKGIGTGLGLSVVHGIIKNHGGLILAYSEEGVGTTFKIFLPVIDALEVDATVKLPVVPTGTERIFVVDDEPAIMNLLKRMLSSLGYTVEAAADPLVALTSLKRSYREFDLLIADMNMPRMSGTRLAERLMAEGASFPVIITSGLSEKITHMLTGNTRIRKILQKPIIKKDLAQAVREVLDGNLLTRKR